MVNGGTTVIFRPSFAISPVLIGIALISGAPALPAQETSKPETAPSACQVRLSSGRAVFKALGEVKGEPGQPPGCGGPDVVLLQRIILPDRTEVAVEPPATLRCEMAEAVTEFVRHDLAAAADALGSSLRAVENYDSFDCRGRNRVAGAKLSEHGRANALDIRSVRLKDGRVVRPTEAAASLAFRTTMKTAACEHFTTVLGPGSDGYHEDHIHIDRIERPSGYRMCQWDVRDEPRFALQSAATQKGAAEPADLRLRATSVRIQGPVPLPPPRPFSAATARAVIPPTESRRR
jgi:hypothetical protein